MSKTHRQDFVHILPLKGIKVVWKQLLNKVDSDL